MSTLEDKTLVHRGKRDYPYRGIHLRYGTEGHPDHAPGRSEKDSRPSGTVQGRDLPEDSKTRLKADFAEIEDELERERHTFGRWRYFETNVGEEAIVAVTNIERAFALAKVARVIIDEGEIAGLAYKVDINVHAKFSVDNGNPRYWETYKLSVTSGEAAIPWDSLLATGQKK